LLWVGGMDLLPRIAVATGGFLSFNALLWVCPPARLSEVNW